MKGVSKFVKRAPTMLSNKVGLSKRSADPEFDDFARNFTIIEQSTDKLIKDTKQFSDNVIGLFTGSAGFAKHFSVIFHPIAGEYDNLGKYPQAERTVKNVDALEGLAEELRTTLAPELELIESRISGPIKDFKKILVSIRKTITKREHKLVDYDRLNSSLTKLRDKKEKSLNDEKNLFKLEQDFDQATQEYEYINNTLKADIPRFMGMATRFIEPLFHSFYFMQLNIFYMTMEKYQAFAESVGIQTAGMTGNQVTSDYEAQKTDAWDQIEALNISKRFISTSKFVQTNRAASGGSSMSRSNTVASDTASVSTGRSVAPPPSRAVSGGTSIKKAPPPPPAAYGSAAPPPYAATTPAASTSAARKPPPPPPLKPKPAPAVQYVTAVYDYDAQADGDLSFRAGDKIEVVERSASADDWWTGKLNGRQGIFPGNYVQD